MGDHATAAMSSTDRERAVGVVSRLLHGECAQWSWIIHRPDAHRADAERIVDALTRTGWAPYHATANETLSSHGQPTDWWN